MTDLTAHADTLDHLERAIRERDVYRLMVRAALDQLAAAHLTMTRQRAQLIDLWEEKRREPVLPG
jgi:hypothetical protein